MNEKTTEKYQETNNAFFINTVEKILEIEKNKNRIIIEKIEGCLEIIKSLKVPIPIKAQTDLAESLIRYDKNIIEIFDDFLNMVNPPEVPQIKTIADFKKIIKPKKNAPSFLRLFYRGQGDKEFGFTPTVFRHNFLSHENDIYCETFHECGSDFPLDMSDLDILVKMQHYGIPTRILDVTKNPLVALYFACSSHSDTDGIVWIIPINSSRILNSSNEILRWVSCLPKINNNDLSDIFLKFRVLKYVVQKHQGKNDFTNINSNMLKLINDFDDNEYINLCHCITKVNEKMNYKFPTFEKVLNTKISTEHERLHDLSFIFSRYEMKYLFCPLLKNPRVSAQEGAFIVFNGDGRIIEDNAHSYGSCRMKDFRDNYCTDYSERVLIPSKSKSNLLEELKHCGISEATLFPDMAVDSSVPNVLNNYADYIKKKIFKKNN